MRTLAGSVHLTDPDSGSVRAFVAGTGEDQLPGWAVEQITNPAAWGEPTEHDAADRLRRAGVDEALVADFLLEIYGEDFDAEERAEVVRKILDASDDEIRQIAATLEAGDEDDDDLTGQAGVDAAPGPADADAGGQEPAPAPPPVDMPRKSASKADWVAYAVGQGVPEDEAKAATRDQLAARFGT